MKRLARFDLNLLRIFDAIYASGGVSAAAHQLHLSQPAISHALAKLRDAFGDPLFVRQGNRLVATPVARALVVPVGEALRGLDAALNSSMAFDSAQSDRSFRIGVRLSGEMPRFSSIVTRVRAAAPRVSLASVAFRRRELVAALANGDIDLVLDVALPSDALLRRHHVGSDPLVVVARPDHPAIVDGVLDIETYLSLDHVVATPRPHGSTIEDVALARLDRDRRVAVRCQHAITAWQIVASSDLLCTLPRLQAAMLDGMWPMQLFDVPFPCDANDAYLYWHQMSDADPGHVWLREIITDEIGSAPPIGIRD